MKRIVLAYSGGFESSIAIPWLRDTFAAEVVTLTLDVGQGRELAHVRESALAAGAVRAHVLDSRDEFVRSHVLPAVAAGAFGPGREFPAPALAHRLIASRLVDMARMESADAVAHGFGASDSARDEFEAMVRELNPRLRILAPVSDWTMSDLELQEYARTHGIAANHGRPSTATQSNVVGRVIHGAAPSYQLTRSVGETPDAPAVLELDLEHGVPIRANGVEMPLIEMIESIETIAGTHGVGRMDGPLASAAESPAAAVLHRAHMELQRRSGATGETGTGRVRLNHFKGTCLVEDSPADFVGDPIGADHAPGALA